METSWSVFPVEEMEVMKKEAKEQIYVKKGLLYSFLFGLLLLFLEGFLMNRWEKYTNPFNYVYIPWWVCVVLLGRLSL